MISPGATILRRYIFLVPLLLTASVQAQSLDIKSCEEANVTIAELVPPVAKRSRTFKDDKISVYEVDTVEPVCCAAGVAVVIPDMEDPLGGNKCLAVVGVASVELGEAAVADDAEKGLLLTIPTRRFNEASDSAPGDPIKLRINADKGTVVAE
jgi:hypothetical protein